MQSFVMEVPKLCQTLAMSIALQPILNLHNLSRTCISLSALAWYESTLESRCICLEMINLFPAIDLSMLHSSVFCLISTDRSIGGTDTSEPRPGIKDTLAMCC